MGANPGPSIDEKLLLQELVGVKVILYLVNTLVQKVSDRRGK